MTSREFETADCGNYEIHIYPTREEMKRTIVEVEPDTASIPEESMGYCNVNAESNLPYILLNEQDMIGDQGTVEHECSHLAFALLRRKAKIDDTANLIMTYHGEDDFCYLVTKLIDSVWECFGDKLKEGTMKDAIKAMEESMSPESIERSDAIFEAEMKKLKRRHRNLRIFILSLALITLGCIWGYFVGVPL